MITKAQDNLLMLHAQGNLIHLPYWDKIKYLRQNPKLHETPIEKDSCGQEIFSNCHGTILFLLGGEEYITGPKWEDHTYPINWSRKPGRPGYVEGGIMKEILNKHSKPLDNPKPGAIVTFWIEGFSTMGDWLCHSAIYSEFLNGRHIIFHQKNIKGRFETSTIEDVLAEYHNYEKVQYHEWIHK